MIKYKANQQFQCRAFDSNGFVTGDAANITCTLQIDDGTRVALTNNTPTEIGATGEYVFDLDRDETNGHALSFVPVSDTDGVQVLGTHKNVIYTVEQTEGTGDVKTTFICQYNNKPVSGVVCRLSTDREGDNMIWGPVISDDNGKAVFFLDSGITYYLWRDSATTATFPNPYEYTVP